MILMSIFLRIPLLYTLHWGHRIIGMTVSSPLFAHFIHYHHIDNIAFIHYILKICLRQRTLDGSPFFYKSSAVLLHFSLFISIGTGSRSPLLRTPTHAHANTRQQYAVSQRCDAYAIVDAGSINSASASDALTAQRHA